MEKWKLRPGYRCERYFPFDHWSGMLRCIRRWFSSQYWGKTLEYKSKETNHFFGKKRNGLRETDMSDTWFFYSSSFSLHIIIEILSHLWFVFYIDCFFEYCISNHTLERETSYQVQIEYPLFSSRRKTEIDDIYAYSLENKCIEGWISVIEAVSLPLSFHYKYRFGVPK